MPSMATGHVIFERSGQAPSPSKDFHQLLVTDEFVIWRSWRITLRKEQIGMPPSQKKLTHEDFYDDTLMPSDINRVFGEHVLKYVQGKIFSDWLVRLPDVLLINLCCYLDLTDIASLGSVCRHLRAICNCNDLWKALYTQWKGSISLEIEDIGDRGCWKKLFFTDHLQLQKQVSRFRRSADQRKRSEGSACMIGEYQQEVQV